MRGCVGAAAVAARDDLPARLERSFHDPNSRFERADVELLWQAALCGDVIGNRECRAHAESAGW